MQFLWPEGCPNAFQRPDLILLDLNLPRLNGHAVLQRLKQNRELCTIPVVILTSSRLPSDILAAYRHGANSYLPKPTSLDEAFDLVRTLEHYWLDLALLPVSPA
jgi:CheY-like chemotaxis protein